MRANITRKSDATRPLSRVNAFNAVTESRPIDGVLVSTLLLAITVFVTIPRVLGARAGFTVAVLSVVVAGFPVYLWVRRHVPSGSIGIPLWFLACLGLGFAFRAVIEETGYPFQLIGDAPARWIAIDRLQSLVPADPSALLRRDTYASNSPMALLFFWAIHSVYGPDPAQLPWQLLVNLLIAACTLALCKGECLRERACRIAFWTVLLFPGLIFFAMYYHRTNLIALALLVAALGMQNVSAGRMLHGLSLLTVGAIMVLGLRLHWSSVLATWLLVLLALGSAAGAARVRVVLALFVGVIASFLLLPHFVGLENWGGPGALLVKQVEVIQRELARGANWGTDSIRLTATGLTGLWAVIGLPVRFVLSTTGYWPWVPRDLVWATVLCFSVPDACLRSGIYWAAFRAWRERKVGNWRLSTTTLLGVIVLMVGLLEIGNFWRYTSPALPLLAPWYASGEDRHPGRMRVGALVWFEAMMLLHLLLILARGRP